MNDMISITKEKDKVTISIIDLNFNPIYRGEMTIDEYNLAIQSKFLYCAISRIDGGENNEQSTT